ncbi:MAG: Sua5/YciO/YrdC/YwlC family protein, partial [Clostridiaceae bacterium]
MLLQKKNEGLLPGNIAPKVNKLGVMLPYTSLHHLLFSEGLPPLIMTSGNISGKPIEYTNEGAIKNIGHVVDYFLLNDREINTPIDDSVVKVVGDMEIVSRLGRGYAPYSFNGKLENKILACGSEMKNTFAFLADGIIYASQYLGDLKDLGAYEEYTKAIENLRSIFEFKPEAVAVDMHPNYMSSIYGKSLNGSKVEVQHHHAHMTSCMLEHNIFDDVIGVIYDGIGFGTDGKVWGAEFLVGNRKEFKRMAHFKYTKIQGGDSAQKDIWKIGVSYLKALHDDSLKEKGLERIQSFVKEDINNVCTALDYNLNCYETSSVGRLYDAVASILGIREKTTYDAQAAIELEAVAKMNVVQSYNYYI